VTRFEPGTRVRLTGPGWDDAYPAEHGLRRGLIVTIEECSMYDGDGAFVAGVDKSPWYVERGGHWAAEPVEALPEYSALQEALQGAEEALEAALATIRSLRA
jgi:hypothetical protein